MSYQSTLDTHKNGLARFLYFILYNQLKIK
nr:MAG TPA: hypothetical protein [Caudoviricetes sp.]